MERRVEVFFYGLFMGGSVAALCFDLPALADGVQSNPDYAAKLRTVAKRLGLPASYVERIGSNSK